MLQLPGFVVLLLLASLVAVILHLSMGRGVRDLLLFWIASVAGSVGGHILGQETGFIHWTLGQVHVAEAAAGAIILVLFAAWLRPPGKRPGAAKP